MIKTHNIQFLCQQGCNSSVAQINEGNFNIPAKARRKALVVALQQEEAHKCVLSPRQSRETTI